MTRIVHPGLYEHLLTSALEAEIKARKEEGWHMDCDPADSTVRSEILARHVYQLVRRVLDGFSNDENTQTTKQIELVNNLVDTLSDHGITKDDRVAEAAQLLIEAIDRPGLKSTPLPRPTLSLRRTGLLVNSRRDVQMAREVVHEIPTADRIDLLCAFVRNTGLRLFQDELKARAQEGVPVRVITSVYTGTTERRALDKLVELGAKVKVSYDTTRTRLHAKAWLFHRKSGLHTAYIGSSNLTHTAQVDGLEWNVRVSVVENPEVIERFEATFEQYWQEPEFNDYIPERHAEKLDDVLSKQRGGGKGENNFPLPPIVDVEPKSHQTVALEALKAERLRGFNRNLVVAATGVGKTWIAAFDFLELQKQNSMQSLLFVAHREEILQQSRQVFQLVLREPSFGELLVAGQRPQVGSFIFASVQSLKNRLDDIEPEDFDVVIVDEFHHAAAKSYEQLLTRLKPKVLLGLTATPERTDGKSVLEWFDGRIAFESRLWDALDQGLLCPFHYFGINDPTDLSSIAFERGRYVQAELDNVLSGDHIRAQRIRQALEKYVSDPREMRALGFCAGVDHAHFMADQFERFGYPSVALDANTPRGERHRARNQLREGKIRIIFTVDLFNEGVDLPEVDTVLMLRPTESPTVFLQQLGRGLRWSKEKQVLTVLDFVGQVRTEYRYDIRYRALLGGTRHQVRQAIEADFPFLPPGCVLKLDSIAKDTVLNNLRQAVHNARVNMVNDLRNLGPDARLKEFMREANVELEEIYSKPNSGHCFSQLRLQANFTDDTDLPDHYNSIFKTLGRMIHVDDLERLENWRKILESNNSSPISSLRGREYRLGLMLFGVLEGNRRSISEADQIVNDIRESTELRREVCDLLEVLSDRIRTVPEPASSLDEVPLASHATYTRGEIMAAYERFDKNGRIFLPREGVLWDKSTNTDLFFVTLEKSEKDFSPMTRYADYPISPTLFHWESQNSTSPNTASGRRYIEQSTRKSNVLLFVRERNRDSRGLALPFHCLGRIFYKRHESERPMKIIWELERPMPGWLFQAGKAVAG